MEAVTADSGGRRADAISSGRGTMFNGLLNASNWKPKFLGEL